MLALIESWNYLFLNFDISSGASNWTNIPSLASPMAPAGTPWWIMFVSPIHSHNYRSKCK